MNYKTNSENSKIKEKKNSINTVKSFILFVINKTTLTCISLNVNSVKNSKLKIKIKNKKMKKLISQSYRKKMCNPYVQILQDTCHKRIVLKVKITKLILNVIYFIRIKKKINTIQLLLKIILFEKKEIYKFQFLLTKKRFS